MSRSGLEARASMRRRGAALVMTAVCTWVAGCSAPATEPDGGVGVPSAGASDAAPGAAAARLAALATPIWVRDERSIGTEAVTVGDTVIAYVSRPDMPIALVGLDAATGEERWVREASMQDLSGSQLTPDVVGDGASGALVAMTSPPVGVDAGWESRLHLLDPRTGEIRASVLGRWVSVFTACDHPEGGVCFYATEVGIDDQQQFHLAPNGDVEPSTAVLPGFESVRFLGAETYAVRDAEGDHVIRQVDGAELWRMPGTEVVGEGLRLVDNMSGWYPKPDAGVLLFTSSIDATDDPFVVSHDAFRSGAIELETGRIAWIREGGSNCHAGDRVMVLCTAGASYTRAEAGGPIETTWGPTVSVVGVDVRTGDERWSHDIAGFDGIANQDRAGALRSFEGGFVFRAASGIEVVDTATGARRPLGPGDAVACTAGVSFDAPEWSLEGERQLTTEGGVAVRACTTEGEVDDPGLFTEAVVLGSWSWTWSPRGAVADPDLRIVLAPGHIAAYGS